MVEIVEQQKWDEAWQQKITAAIKSDDLAGVSAHLHARDEEMSRRFAGKSVSTQMAPRVRIPPAVVEYAQMNGQSDLMEKILYFEAYEQKRRDVQTHMKMIHPAPVKQFACSMDVVMMLLANGQLFTWGNANCWPQQVVLDQGTVTMNVERLPQLMREKVRGWRGGLGWIGLVGGWVWWWVLGVVCERVCVLHVLCVRCPVFCVSPVPCRVCGENV